jgi:hypothetical protein
VAERAQGSNITRFTSAREARRETPSVAERARGSNITRFTSARAGI